MKIGFKRRIRMNWFVRILILLVSLAHLALAIGVTIQTIAETDATSPILSVFDKYGDTVYRQSNSQVKATVMPYLVAVIGLLTFIFPYYFMLYTLFIFVLMELGTFIWALVILAQINEDQEANYILVKELILQVELNHSAGRRKRDFGITTIVTAITVAAGILTIIVSLKDIITDVVGFIKKWASSGSPNYEKVHKKYGDSMEAIVKEFNEKPKLLKSYVDLTAVFSANELMDEIAILWCVLTLIFILVLIIYYNVREEPEDPVKPAKKNKKKPFTKSSSSGSPYSYF